jgi:transposase-like protein
MLNTKLPPMRPELIVCPFCECRNRIGVHSHQQRRYICHACHKTFAETAGTLLYGLKYPAWIVTLVLALRAAGCPPQAIVFAFGIDERTVCDWQAKAGQHAQQIQEQVVCQGRVELGQVQADELYVKMQSAKVWMATAMTVFSRLFLWGAISTHRDELLIEQIIQHVRAAAQLHQPILFAVDGLRAYVTAILRVFRNPVHTGHRGRPHLVVWADLHIVQVVKHRVGQRLDSIERRVVHGCQPAAEAIMQATQVELGVINTAYIERLNATFRTWMPALFRRTRAPARQVVHLEAAMFWMGCVYNFCRIHRTLATTPAVAADLTEHVWTVDELLRFRPRRM